VFQHLGEEEKEHLGKLEARYAELLQRDPQLEARPTFLFFKGAANGIFSEGTERLSAGNDQQALLIGIKCERGSHRFFKKYGEQFEESEGKADLPRVRRRRARASRAAHSRIPRAREAPGPAAPSAPCHHAVPARRRAVIDLHLHTTASDGRLTPACSSISPRVGAARDGGHRSRHHRRGGRRAGVRARQGGKRVAGIEITAVLDGRDVHMLAYFVDIDDAAFQRFLPSQRASRVARLEAIGAAWRSWACRCASKRRWRCAVCSPACRWDVRRRRVRWWRPAM
jgi:hypothetical protein